MPTGRGFTPEERQSIDKAIRDAEAICRLEFSVFVGTVEGEPRAFAERLLDTLVAPARSVLIAVDPAARKLAVATGAESRRTLVDHEVRVAVEQMRTAFAENDLAGGLRSGLLLMGEYARKPETLHAG